MAKNDKRAQEEHAARIKFIEAQTARENAHAELLRVQAEEIRNATKSS